MEKNTDHEDSGKKTPNRLIQEKSPYLLQHAYNPVDWYPWGEGAFAKARKENKPIFLSVGYSTCHWCHVMERESFEDPQIARIMNERFVNIKVDREERPDVDRVYMTFVQATAGSGGWPMSVWLTPDLKPFHGATYFPPDDRHGQPGFASILLRIAEVWKNEQDRVIASSKSLMQSIQNSLQVEATGSANPDELLLDKGYEQFATSYDAQYGGFGQAPKFPRPVAFNFLLRYWTRTGKKEALDMVLFTLSKRACGGLHDHVGGGFHRYATDRIWLVPHFEKMLYDQAQLACSYLDAYQITRDSFYANVARGILNYVLRDMAHPEGGFTSAEDADSSISFDQPEEHSEGAFYVWTQDELVRALGGETAELFNHHYSVRPSGNVAQDRFGEFKNKNILIVSRTVEEIAKESQRAPEEVAREIALAREKLLEVRAKRPRPHRDDKVLTAWNGLMISAYARASQILDEERYIRASERAAGFIRDRLFVKETGELKRRHRDGQSDIEGYADDYAFLIQGLIDLHEASVDILWLKWALQLQEKQDQLFWDEENGGYFMTTGHDPSVLLRMKENYDGAEPSPNSVAVLNLLRLSQMTGNRDHDDKAERTLRLFAAQLHVPQAMPQMLAAADFYLDRPKQIVIAGRRGSQDTKAMLRAVHERFMPNKVVLLADGGSGQQELGELLPFIKDVRMLDGRATAYVCEKYLCQLPTNSIEIMRQQLSK
jgi:uncharacterized protein YyaL (SSP411 family)